jgi:hypothetical protein
LKRLEIAYLGKIQGGHEKRRASNVRMACFDLLAQGNVSSADGLRVKQDIRKTHELILMTPFGRAYHDKYGDLEMWVEIISRFRSALGMRPFNFGPQSVVFKVHDPIDVRPHMERYVALQTDVLRRGYLSDQTEMLRRILQSGVDEIHRARRQRTG